MEAVLSWGSLVLVVLLSIIYPLRVLKSKFNLSINHPLSRLNSFLRIAHKKLGGFSILWVWMHCSVSERNTGTDSYIGILLLIMLILLALSYPLRRIVGEKWMLIHRLLTVALLLGSVFHSFVEFM